MTFPDALLLSPLATLPPATYAGALAVAVNCSWPLQKSRHVILALQTVSALLFGLHYLLLGSPTAAAICAAGVVQAVGAATIANRRLRLSVFGATILVSLATTVATFAGVTSVLAQGGGLWSAYGRLQRGAQAIRWCFLASEAFWVTHNLIVGSTWGLTSDSLAIPTLLIGLWRGGAFATLRENARKRATAARRRRQFS